MEIRDIITTCTEAAEALERTLPTLSDNDRLIAAADVATLKEAVWHAKMLEESLVYLRTYDRI